MTNIDYVLTAAFLLSVEALAQAAPRVNDPDVSLKEANRLAWLKNWTAAAPLFAEAEKGFERRGDRRNALYAKIGRIRGNLSQMALFEASEELEQYLELPIVQADPKLRLHCLITKGDADLDFDTQLAVDDWEKARDVAQQLGDQQWIARAEGELGIIMFLQGDSTKAATMVFKALQSAKASHDVGAEIRYLTLLGRGMAEFGNTDEGLNLIDSAFALATRQPDLGIPMYLWSHKASVLEKMNRYEEAESVLRKALDFARKNEHEAFGASISIELGTIYIDRKEFKRAADVLITARQTAKNANYLRTAAEADRALSQCHRYLGDLNQALIFSSEGVEISRQLGDRSQLPFQLGELAAIESELGRLSQAEASYQLAEDLIQGLLANTVSPSAKASLLGELSTVYLGHFNLEVYPRRNPGRAFKVIEEVRGRSTADLLQVPLVKRLSPQQKQAQREISRLQYHLMQTTIHAKRQVLLDQILATEASSVPSQGSIQPLDNAPIPSSTTVKKFRGSLKPHELFVEYVLDDPRSTALVVDQTGIRIETLAGKTKITALAKDFLEHIDADLSGEPAAAELARILLEPLRLKSETSRVIIAPDGLLNQIPFEVLPHVGTLLLHSAAVSYSPSATVLMLLRRKPSIRTGEILLVSGGPATDIGPPLLGKNVVRGVYDVDFAKLPPLAAADDEIRDIAKTISLRATLLPGAEASEDRVKALPLGDYEAMHFATHGVASTKFPDRSALVLRPSRTGEEDGLLQVREIRGLRLNADLVTLSACNSSVGKLKGEEGVANLVQAFLWAGARSVVASLWTVNDEFSRDFMNRFYQQLANGLAIDASLRGAKLSLIHDYGSSIKPSVWSGFVVYGDAKRTVR